MITGGVSIIGSYHEVNQDSYLCKPYEDGYILVVSDGMGSKSLSHLGSKYVCESVYSVISNIKLNMDKIGFQDTIYACYEEWKKCLSGQDIEQYYATLLLIVIRENKISAARLGDGFISIYLDNKVISLYDKKEDYFINETDCFKEYFDRDKFELVEVEYYKFHGAVVCTDGVEIGKMQEEDISNFTQDFVNEYSSEAETDVILEIESWLKDWPGSDDKTLAFMINEVI